MENNSDLRTLYQVTIEDIRFAKLQQWRITYYALLLYSGLIIFWSYLKEGERVLCDFEITILFLIALVVAIAGIYILIKLQSSMIGYRNTILRIRDKLSQEFKDVWSDDGKVSPQYTSWTYDKVFYFLIVTVVCGLGIVFWYFVREAILK